jgi:predicted transcriptional regulator
MIEENKRMILDAMRVLTLLFGFKDKKSYQMSFDRIILFDFYLKFPKTMSANLNDKKKQYDFEELYSFYHAHPNRESYSRILRFLIGKGLIEKTIKLGSYTYSITDLGETVIRNFENQYALDLIRQSNFISKEISKLSETKLKESILEMTTANFKLSID